MAEFAATTGTGDRYPSAGPIVGREREMHDLAKLVRRDSIRAVTLTGPAGVGKTRLAREVAAAVDIAYADGACFVPLEALASVELLPSAIAHAVGIGDPGEEPILDALARHLRGQHLLLVLDHVDRLLPAMAPVAALLRAARGLTVLTTSRTSLLLPEARPFVLGPLAVPRAGTPSGGLRTPESDAVRLLLERARAGAPASRSLAAGDPALGELARLAGGVPLALELVAARLAVLSPGEVRDNLRARRAPGTDDQPLDAAAVIGWSDELLGPQDRRLFRQLGVFAGGFAVPDATAIADAGLADGMAGGLRSLVAHGLLRQASIVETMSGTGPHYVMPASVRDVALARLAAAGEAAEVRRRHARYVLALVAGAESRLLGPQQVAWYQRLNAQYDDIRAALEWAIEHDDASLGQLAARALWRFWETEGHVHEGRAWLARLLALGPGPARIGALFGAGRLAYVQRDYPAAEAYFRECLELSREQGDDRLVSGSLTQLGHIAMLRGHLDEAHRLYDEGLAIRRRLDDRWAIAISQQSLGRLAARMGDPERGATLYTDAIQRFLDSGDRLNAARSMQQLGELLLGNADRARARPLLEESLTLRRELGDARGTAASLTVLGALERQQGNVERARALLTEALHIHRDTGDREGAARTLLELGRAALAAGDTERARHVLPESLALYRERGNLVGIAACVEGFAALRSSDGDPGSAARLYAAAAAVRERSASAVPATVAERVRLEHEQLRVTLGAAAWDAAWASIHDLALDELIALALDSGADTGTARQTADT
jgi:predicted ATPase